jgi:hypothetical protein
MSPGRVYLDYLEDLLDALHKSRQFVVYMSFEEFLRLLGRKLSLTSWIFPRVAP